MAFIDEVEFTLTAGKGGNGVVRWRQEKFKPRSGPGGGNGGKGGDVYIEAVSDLSYLSNYQFAKSFEAKHGEDGSNYGMQGASGEDLVLKLPVGSIVRQPESGFEWFLDRVGQRERILKGGRGGLGNEHFKSSRNVSPEESTPGAEGESGIFTIELQLFADVGLVGLPNAGKSSLLNALTGSKAKVGDYQFTTLDPNLGKFHEFVIADIPGLIEGASEGKGLGAKFLRHVSRTKMLVHLVSCENDDVLGAYKTVRTELVKSDLPISEKPEMILLTKKDMVDSSLLEKQKKLLAKLKVPMYTITLFDDGEIKQFADMLVAHLRSIGLLSNDRGDTAK